MSNIQFETAQFVHVDYELAAPVMRALASLIDVVAFFVYFIIFYMFFGSALFGVGEGMSEVITLLFIRIPWIFYSPLIEYITRGQSLGKYVVGVRVVNSNGENAGFRAYFTRWIFRVVDIWLGLGFLALLFSGTSKHRQRLGDMLAGTVVIKRSNSRTYTLQDVLRIQNRENHEVTYPDVLRFTDEDMILVKTTLQRLENYPSSETKKFTVELAEETARLLNVSPVPDKKVTFLKTVLMDYVVLTR